MIAAAPTGLGRWFWETFTHLALRRRFHTVEADLLPETDPGRAILLIGNHISWWDGFWGIWLNKHRFGRRFFVMMLEEELRKRPFMRRGGAFSIRPGSRDVLRSIDYTRALLTDPRNLVLLFPQGRIHSLYETEIRFAPGVARILRESPCQVVFYAALLDYGSHPRPSLRFYLAACPPGTAPADIEAAYQQFYTQRLAAWQAAQPG
ncbi:MAG: hypothetical protein OHK0039_25310 [Bacteroidia bacterium]